MMKTSESPRQLGSDDVTEVSLPGIGQRYDLRTVDGGRVSVVIHRTVDEISI